MSKKESLSVWIMLLVGIVILWLGSFGAPTITDALLFKRISMEGGGNRAAPSVFSDQLSIFLLYLVEAFLFTLIANSILRKTKKNILSNYAWSLLVAGITLLPCALVNLVLYFFPMITVYLALLTFGTALILVPIYMLYAKGIFFVGLVISYLEDAGNKWRSLALLYVVGIGLAYIQESKHLDRLMYGELTKYLPDEGRCQKPADYENCQTEKADLMMDPRLCPRFSTEGKACVERIAANAQDVKTCMALEQRLFTGGSLAKAGARSFRDADLRVMASCWKLFPESQERAVFCSTLFRITKDSVSLRASGCSVVMVGNKLRLEDKILKTVGTQDPCLQARERQDGLALIKNRCFEGLGKSWRDGQGKTLAHLALGALSSGNLGMDGFDSAIYHSDIDGQDFEGNTPLHISPTGMISTLLDKGASLNIRNNAGDTPLLRWIKVNRHNPFSSSSLRGYNFKLLAKHGVDWNATDSDGNTAIHLLLREATQYEPDKLVLLMQSLKIVEELIQRGANPGIMAKDGVSGSALLERARKEIEVHGAAVKNINKRKKKNERTRSPP